MSYDILSKYVERTGWNSDSQIDVLCEYIINQCDDVAFEDFLKEKTDEEFDSSPCLKCGSDVDKDGFCEDETCPYSDWPQNTPRTVFIKNMSREEAERTYGVKKRRG